jgi:hypothetical protein
LATAGKADSDHRVHRRGNAGARDWHLLKAVKSASYPKAALSLPLVLSKSASYPEAVL